MREAIESAELQNDRVTRIVDVMAQQRVLSTEYCS